MPTLIAVPLEKLQRLLELNAYYQYDCGVPGVDEEHHKLTQEFMTLLENPAVVENKAPVAKAKQRECVLHHAEQFYQKKDRMALTLSMLYVMGMQRDVMPPIPDDICDLNPREGDSTEQLAWFILPCHPNGLSGYVKVLEHLLEGIVPASTDFARVMNALPEMGVVTDDMGRLSMLNFANEKFFELIGADMTERALELINSRAKIIY